MRFVSAFFLLAFAFTALAQERGTITGTLTDSSGAIVPDVVVVATNAGTGVTSQTVTTSTGNYTIPGLPVGVYTVTAEKSGFKKSSQENVQLAVATTVRVDVRLDLGAVSETVSVTAESQLLKTESAEQSTVVATDRVNDLPLNFGGGGSNVGQVRNPFAFALLSPGVTGAGAGTGGAASAVVNGLPGATYKILVEGQDVTSSNEAGFTSSASHVAMDTLEEFSLQSSNFSAEYGQAAAGIYNMVTKSGTNQLHGSVFEYLTNEDLDAYRPYFTPQVPAANPRTRKHDFGGTVGGPVWIPKLYDGRNKTFFFFGDEFYRNKVLANGATFTTVPTAAMRGGDFSGKQLFVGNQIGTDPNTGVAILNGAIYDPATRTTYPNGQVSTTPFVGNLIPVSRFDPVAARIQALIPPPTNGLQTSNFAQNTFTYFRQSIPSIKIDQVLPHNARLSFYGQYMSEDKSNTVDGLPEPITATHQQRVYGWIPRLNYDQSLTPTFLIHLGLGFSRFFNPDHADYPTLDYDAVGQLGFVGSATSIQGNPQTHTKAAGFPRIVGLPPAMGPSTGNQFFDSQFTSVTSATWVHGNHTFKFGGEYRAPSWVDHGFRGSQGILNFNANETGDPYSQSNNFGSGSVGNAYASFLLGQIDTALVNSVYDLGFRRWEVAFYAQDTWKVTRKLTLDYGLRYDYQIFGHEHHNQWSEFGPATPNPSVNNIPGALIFEGNGPGRCNCSFTKNYPYAFAPRLGVAYQLDSKTVLRLGAGLTFSPVAEFFYLTLLTPSGVGVNQIAFNPPGGAFGLPGATLSGGLQYPASALTVATLNPGSFPAVPGTIAPTTIYEDPNAGRPSRVFMWNLGLQREVLRGLVVEAAYVGNRGVWENGPGGGGPSFLLGGLNTPNPASFAKYGIDPTTTAGQQTLQATMGSALGKASGVPLPYPSFPLTASVLQALRPYPHVQSLVTSCSGFTFGAPCVLGAPLGKNWYDSLQVKATKRYTHGLSVITAFTWDKAQANPAGTGTATLNNIFNRDLQKGITPADIPFIFNIGFSYETQKYGMFAKSRILTEVVSGWKLGGLLNYQSGALIATPTSTNNQAAWYGQTTLMNRVAGQPLYLPNSNPNCHCVDPTTQFVLNPQAWANPALGQWGTGAPYYSDFRAPRAPQESMNISRLFRIRENMSFEIRAEFFNVFNRLELNAPTASNPLGSRTCNNGAIAAGATTCNAGGTAPSGYGAIGYTTLSTQPRNGQLVARIRF